MKSISIKNNKFIIKIPYDINLINLIKSSFNNKSWDVANKVWQAPINLKNMVTVFSFLEKYGFTTSPDTNLELEKWKDQLEQQKIEDNIMVEKSKATNSDIEIPTSILGDLFPFQKAGVAFIEDRNGRALLADEMGLGKSLQSIVHTQLHPEKSPVLVICPATLKINWQREFEKWTGIKSYIINSKDNNVNIPKNYKVYIINYDIVEKKKELLTGLKFQIAILDECHRLKNTKTKWTKAVNEIAVNIPHIIAITGTPILNRPIEIYNVAKLLSPKDFGNYWEFATRYCGMTRTRWGIDVSGATNIDELAIKLRSTIMVRREKKDVLAELPDKTRIVIPLEVDLKEYKKVEDDLVNYLIENKSKTALQAIAVSQVEQLAKVEYCKQEAVKAKLESFVEWVKNIQEENKKLVIFAHHIEFIDKLMSELKSYNSVSIVGSMKQEDRQKSIDTFQNDPDCKIIVCSIKAAGVGITLTASSYVAFLELGWTPADHDQAEDRCHRIGQKNNVTCYYFLAENTIEQDIFKLIQAKRKISKELLQDNTNIVEEKQNIFTDLLTKLTDRR